MATHSSILAWRIPWMEEPGRLQSMGSQRVGHDWAHTSIHCHTLAEGLWVRDLTLPNMSGAVPHLCGDGTWLSLSVVVRGRCLIKFSFHLLCRMSVMCGEKSRALLDQEDITRGCLHMQPLLSCWLENTGSCPQGPLSSFILNIIYLFDCVMSLIVVVAFRVLTYSMLGSSSLTRDGTQAPCVGTVKSWTLDHQGSPSRCWWWFFFFAWKRVDADACFTTLEFATYLSGVTQAPLPLGVNRVIPILAHKENRDPARHSDLSVALDLRSFTSANALQLSANNSLLDGWWGRPWTWLCLH